ncbi:MAG: HEPN domain-containing protein [Candidatus Hydrogenedentes bacterium]|nr:HEPN domain-containing protein [Candidatus Hydrogenedentota bacterium]
MSVNDDARLMYLKAQSDLRAIHGMSDSSVFSDDIFGFHAQQAVEKLPKAWLWSLDVEPPYIHGLGELVKLLEHSGASLPEQLQSLEHLTDFAVHFRYSADMAPLDESREDIASKVEELSEHIRTIIPDIGQSDEDSEKVS